MYDGHGFDLHIIFIGFSLFKLVGRPLLLIGTLVKSIYVTTDICQRLDLLATGVIGM